MTTLTGHRSFLSDVLSRQLNRRALFDPTHTFPSQPTITGIPTQEADDPLQPSKAKVLNYVSEEETIRNDYAAWYGVSGEFESNHILGAGDEEICEECVGPISLCILNLR